MKANWTPIKPGDARTFTSLNQLFADLETGSSQVDERNFAEEGIDARPLETHPVANATDLVEETSRNAATLAPAAAMTQFVHNGTAFRINAPGALGDDEAYRFRFICRFQSTVSSWLGFNNASFAFRIAWNNGAATAKVEYSERRLYRPNILYWAHATAFTEGWLFGPEATISWVEVQYLLVTAGVEVFPSKSIFWCDRFRRINQV